MKLLETVDRESSGAVEMRNFWMYLTTKPQTKWRNAWMASSTYEEKKLHSIVFFNVQVLYKQTVLT